MKGFRLGRILGFEVRVDFSWFILFFLILWSFSGTVFPSQAPGYGGGTYLLMGLAGALLFFVSLLAHELSHSVVARARGIPVEGITLFLFGGMAHTRTEAETPGDEFRIAVVGPLMSLAIAAVLAGVWYGGVQLGLNRAVLAVAQYLAGLNFVLAVFNLLPGFPLDGGRLFRAAAWKVTGDVRRATRIASTGGQWLGFVLIALGLLSAFTGNMLGGLWLVFIGWFLRNAAVSSYQQHLALSLLSGVRAEQVMSATPESVPPSLTVRTLMDEYFMRRRYAAYPVVEQGAVRGLVTVHAAREVPREEWDTRTAADIMLPADDSIIVRPEDDMVQVLEKLRASPARRLLVVSDGALVGIITSGDVAVRLERARGGPVE